MKSLTRGERRRKRKVLLGSEEFKKQTKTKQQEHQNNVARGKKEENNPPPEPHGCFNEVPCASGMQGEKEFSEGQELLHLHKVPVSVSGNHMV